MQKFQYCPKNNNNNNNNNNSHQVMTCGSAGKNYLLLLSNHSFQVPIGRSQSSELFHGSSQNNNITESTSDQGLSSEGYDPSKPEGSSSADADSAAPSAESTCINKRHSMPPARISSPSSPSELPLLSASPANSAGGGNAVNGCVIKFPNDVKHDEEDEDDDERVSETAALTNC